MLMSIMPNTLGRDLYYLLYLQVSCAPSVHCVMQSRLETAMLQEKNNTNAGSLKKELGVFDLTMLGVGCVVGTGIFCTHRSCSLIDFLLKRLIYDVPCPSYGIFDRTSMTYPIFSAL